MLRNHFRLLSTLIRLLDLAFLCLAMWLAQHMTARFPEISEVSAVLSANDGPTWILPNPPMAVWLGQMLIVLLLWGSFSWRMGLYDSQRTQSRFALALLVGKSLVFAVGFGSLAALLVFGSLVFHPLLALIFAFILLTGVRLLLKSALYLARSQGFNYRRILFVGRGVGACSFLQEIDHKSHYGLRVLGALSFPDEEQLSDAQIAQLGGVTRDQVEDLGAIAKFQQVFSELDVDQVLIFPSGGTRDAEVAELCRDCDSVGIQYLYTPGYLAENRVSAQPHWCGSVPSLSFHAGHQPTASLAIKRVIDILGSGLGLALLSPLLLAVAVIIKLSDRGPVFFKQVRVGKGGKRFACYKFRSMLCDAEQTKELLLSRNEVDGPVFKIRHDPRVTALGRFLRKFSLDELPQLWNVFLGDMSLVGPRPPVPEEVRRYEWWQRRRLAVKPGLTCIWQVWGRNEVSFKRWVEMDIQYIERWSLWLDAKLILHTFGVVVRGTGM